MFTAKNFGNERSLKITSIKDSRLLKIDPSRRGFFNNILSYSSEDERINNFIQSVKEVKAAEIPFFWKPFCDPTFNGKDIIFVKGMPAAVGHSFNWWTSKVSQMSPVDGRIWSIGTDQQYIAFLVWLINRLVHSGLDIDTAVNGVVIDSKNLGIYLNSVDQKFKLIGSGTRIICQCCDLATRIKILKSTNGGFYEASGAYVHNSYEYPLARIEHCNLVDHSSNLSTCWLILSNNMYNSKKPYLYWL